MNGVRIGVNWRAVRRAGVVLICGASTACAGDERTRPGEPDGGVFGEPDDGATSSAQPGGDAASFYVMVRSEQPLICAGDCTELTASASASNGELSFSWDHELGKEATVRVCPIEDTTYTVEATLRASGSEFASAQTARESRTVSVRSCDEPQSSHVACEARMRTNTPSGESAFESATPWATFVGGDATVVSSATGEVYFIGVYGVGLDLGADRLTTQAPAAGFVHKLDADCKPAWTRSLEPRVPSDVFTPLAMALDDAGAIYVASVGGPAVVIGTAVVFATELVVDKLSSTGESLYRARFSIGPGAMVSTMNMDGEGNAYVHGIANALSDFGGGSLGLSPSEFRTFSLVLDARGDFVRSIPDTGVFGTSRAGGALYTRHGGAQSLDVFGALIGTQTVYLPAETKRWSLPEFDLGVSIGSSDEDVQAGDVAALAAGGCVLAAQRAVSDELGVEERSSVLLAYTADGRERLRTEVLAQTLPPPSDDPLVFAWPSTLSRIDALPDGSLAALAVVGPDTRLFDTRLPDPDSASLQQSTLVMQIDGEHRLLWSEAITGESQRWVSGFTTNARAEIVAMGTEGVRDASAMATGSEQDIVVTKYRTSP